MERPSRSGDGGCGAGTEADGYWAGVELLGENVLERCDDLGGETT